jgi:Alw26I/Eco31I/Esp3I family type II restriction endonuclease
MVKAAKPARPKYGGRGRPWHPDFIKYVEEIARHPVYVGMPDAFPTPNRIQWEAPSNRLSGQFKDTHHKRRKWWENKAREIGIDPTSASWISRTAKALHPFKRKPCKICGRVLELRYAYPQDRLLKRLASLDFIDPNFRFDKLEPLPALVRRLYAAYGEQLLASLPEVLSTQSIATPNPPPRGLEGWIDWIEKDYIPREPPLLSPGAMSNAPDRFDGFHSDNLCCRGTADKGRTKKNLASYITDRRVFEYWAAGDWIAADRLMGVLRSEHFENQECRNGHPGPCSADHIGPISLGFTHRPCFQALCKACNSGKNNRMTASDVRFLLAHEKAGEQVISWHSQSLWDLRKANVKDNETALRLSKLLRDNRHALMAALQAIADAGHYTFLTTLLELKHADFDVAFKNLRTVDHVTVCDEIVRTKRNTKYAAEQKARRCRIALQELFFYFEKENRNSFVAETLKAKKFIGECLRELAALGQTSLDRKIKCAAMEDSSKADTAFLPLIGEIDAVDPRRFWAARVALQAHMDAVGEALSAMWEDDRYVRS